MTPATMGSAGLTFLFTGMCPALMAWLDWMSALTMIFMKARAAF